MPQKKQLKNKKMMPQPNHLFSPEIMASIEFIYSSIMVFFCFLIYYKTKEISELSRYPGIKYFRTTFLLFGLSYVLQFIIGLFQLSLMTFLDIGPRKVFFPTTLLLTGYLSTLAIFYLAYSTSWRNLSFPFFFLASNLLSLFVVIVSLWTRSPLYISLIQLLLLVLTISLVFFSKKKKSGKVNTTILYFLIGLFWMINLLFLESPRFFFPELKILFEVISISIFAFLYMKVKKWTL